MCCGETFNNTQSLKYHLLSITDNLYCPGCSQRSDSVAALIQHLDRCEQDLERKVRLDVLTDKLRKDSEAKMDAKMQINRSFLATVSDNGIVIMGDPQMIQMDENDVRRALQHQRWQSAKEAAADAGISDCSCIKFYCR